MTLDIVAPAIGTDDCAGGSGIVSELGESINGGFEVTRGVEDTLSDDACAAGNAEAVKRTVGVGFASGAVAGDDAGDMGAVAVFVRRIGERAVKEEGRRSTKEIGMHGCGVAVVEAAVGDRDFHTSTGVAEGLGEQFVNAAIARHY